MNKFNYKWYLKDNYNVENIEKHNKKVFSTFSCGGGSTMGYKLAGYKVIGANDLDPKMAKVYKHNHKPDFYYLGSISDLKEIELPDELFDLDILDGSPPCKTFSMAGSREKKWLKSEKYNERMREEVISDLFFEFIDVVNRLKPKVVIAENVKGIVIGNAKSYSVEIIKRFENIGYSTQIFILNAKSAGVPQARERVFFIASRKDLNLPKLKLDFNEPEIPLSEVEKNAKNKFGDKLSNSFLRYWIGTPIGKPLSYAHPKGSYFTSIKVSPDKPLNTIVATSGSKLCHYEQPYELSDELLQLCGSYPLDYEFIELDAKTLCGRSVPPVLMANISNQVYEQWLKNL